MWKGYYLPETTKAGNCRLSMILYVWKPLGADPASHSFLPCCLGVSGIGGWSLYLALLKLPFTPFMLFLSDSIYLLDILH